MKRPQRRRFGELAARSDDARGVAMITVCGGIFSDSDINTSTDLNGDIYDVLPHRNALIGWYLSSGAAMVFSVQTGMFGGAGQSIEQSIDRVLLSRFQCQF